MGEMVKVSFEQEAGCQFIKSDDGNLKIPTSSAKGNALTLIFGSLMNTADEYQKTIVDEVEARTVHYNVLGTNTLMVFKDEDQIILAWCRDDNARDIVCGATKSLKSNEPHYVCKFDKDATVDELEKLALNRHAVLAWSETFKSDNPPGSGLTLDPNPPITTRKVAPIWVTFSATDSISHPASAESYKTITGLAAHVSLAGTEVTAKFEDFAALSDAISYLEKQELEFTVSVHQD